MNSKPSQSIIFLLLSDKFKAVLYFPFWWYSKGFLRIIKATWQAILDMEQTLGFFIWLKNLFVPMFGQKSIADRIISFILRILEIIFRGIILAAFSLLMIIFIIAWLVIPIFIIYQIIKFL